MLILFRADICPIISIAGKPGNEVSIKVLFSLVSREMKMNETTTANEVIINILNLHESMI